MNQEAAKALEEACSTEKCGCALERLSFKHPDINGSLSHIAGKLGFTWSEAWGIMGGWDAAQAGSEELFYLYQQENLDEYNEGYLLGCELYQRFGV